MSLKKVGRWFKRRASESSTLVGVTTIIAPIIAPKLGLPVDVTTQLIMTGIGALLAGATTKNHTPVHEL